MFKKVIWLLLGAVTVLVLLVPEVVIFGLMLFIVPGIVLSIIPSIFIYSTFAALLKHALQNTSLRFPTFISFVAVLIIGGLISLSLNLPIWSRINKISEQDIALDGKLPFPDTIAIFSDEFKSRFQNPEEPLCNQLCQKLLYNRATERVLVGIDYDSSAEEMVDRKMISYTIEKGENCPQDGFVSIKNKEDFLINNVSLRMAAGECLKKSFMPLSQADLIFIQHPIDGARKAITAPWEIGLNTIRASRIEFLKKSDKSYLPIYRYTKIEAEPFIMPLTVGPISGYGLNMKSGFLRYSKYVNTTGVHYYNFLQDFEIQMKEIFGDAIQDPKTDQTINVSLSAKLNDPSADSSELTKLFGLFVADYVVNRKREVSPQDEEVIIRSLHDDRIKDLWSVGYIIKASTEVQKTKIVNAAIDRIFAEPLPRGENNIQGLLNSLYWSATEVPLTDDQRKTLEKKPQHQEFIRAYLNVKITGGWSRDGNIERYLQNW